MNGKALKIVNTVFFVAMIIITVLANVIPIGIGTAAEISEKYPNLFIPAPFTFAITGVIYLLMALFVLYQWGLFGSRYMSERDTERIGIWFAFSCAMNIGWVISWNSNLIALSLVFTAGLLASLAVIGRKINRYERTGLGYAAVNVGFDTYLGWAIAAFAVNAGVLLVSIGWNGFGLSETTWTSIILMTVAFVGSLPVLIGRKWFASFALIWAYAGLLARHVGMTEFAGEYPTIITFSITGIIVMTLALTIKSIAVDYRDSIFEYPNYTYYGGYYEKYNHV